MTTTTRAAGPTTHEAARIVTRAGPAKFLGDTGAVFAREILLTLRDPFTLVFSLIQPLVFLGLFGPLLVGTYGGTGQTTGETLQWFVPGVIVMICMFGTSMTGANLLYEVMTGSYERVLATPLNRPAILVGRALKEFAPLLVQGVIIALVSAPFGFQIHVLPGLIGLVLLGIFGIGIGALSHALALASRNREWLFWGVQQSLLFPLLILSGMMLPLEAGPGWMRVAARFNPLTYMVDGERLLFAGVLDDPKVLWCALAAIATCAVGLFAGIRATRRTA